MKVKMPNTINYLTPLENSFSNNYLSVRKKENRIFSDNEVVNLPKTDVKNPNYLESKAREFSSNKVLNYLIKKQKPMKILDLGCGNGWFSNKISKIENTSVTAIDVNIIELEQANKLFQNSNLEFVYGDFFKIDSFENQFDCIILNGCIQYFSDLNLLLAKLKSFLRDNGEIHIFDSPFYKPNQINLAKANTKKYYSKLGFPEMTTFYHHHLFESLGAYRLECKPVNSIINKLFRLTNNPFCWIIIEKE